MKSTLALTTLILVAGTMPSTGPAQDTLPGREILRHPIRRLMPVRTVSTNVAVEITDGVADTHVTLKFRNDGPRIAEKIVLFPLPKGATADEIQMMVGDKMQKGEILDKNKARGIYESIVRRRRDPALLEYMGRDLLRLRVFPIQPRSTQTVKVRFRMVLPMSAGLLSFEFPTRAVEGGSFALAAKIHSRKPIKTVYSPIAGFDVVRKDDHNASASFECKGRPKRDPLLFYGLSDRDFGLNLLTYRKQGKEGYFLAMLAPKRDWKQEKELKKSITFVLDTSGSMQGEKIKQARGALRYFVQSLKPTDRFNIIPFSTEARPFADSAVAATEDQIKKALKFIDDEVEARGGTNIHEALTTALRSTPADGLVPIVVFLTDGLPTIGVTDVKQILSDCAKANQSKARVFAFGVGSDVNTHLLDKLSDATSGTRDYVRPGENIEVKVSALFEKLAHPVMRDVELKVDGIQWSRLVPNKLGDMFRGSHVVIAGRYSGHGDVAIRLSGKVGDSNKEFVFDAKFPEVAEEHDFVATIWAQRRVGQLLDAIRLNGQNAELVGEIRRIGKEHGIVTPYTSHLIVEEGEQLAMGLRRVRGIRFDRAPGAQAARVVDELQRDGAKITHELNDVVAEEKAEASKKGKRALQNLGRAASGETAVDDSRQIQGFFRAGKLADRSRLFTTRRIKDKTFHLVGSTWVDGSYKIEMEKQLKKIEAFSPEYFELLHKHPKLTRYLSFSTAMIVVLDGTQAIEVTPPKQ